METLSIGVVVPTWNSAASLDWTLLSLRSQLGCDVRIVVADSGSTDATLEICQRWSVETIYVPPGNMYSAINAGMRRLDTRWLTYLNSDDLVYADAYARLIRLGETSRADVVYGQSDFVDAAGRFLYSMRAVPQSLHRGLTLHGVMGFAQPAAVFTHALYQELGGFNDNYRLIADFEFFARALRQSKRFATLPPPSVTAFRLHEKQLSYKGRQHNREEKKHLLAQWEWNPSLFGFCALTAWRLSNWRHYAIRSLRTGSLRWR